MDKIKSVAFWLLRRGKEPSTWAGTSVVAMAIHSLFPGALGDSLLVFGGAFFGLVAVVLPEGE